VSVCRTVHAMDSFSDEMTYESCLEEAQSRLKGSQCIVQVCVCVCACECECDCVCVCVSVSVCVCACE